MKNHQYKTKVIWTGNTGKSTNNYRSYQRNYTISVDGKADILGSSDPAFLGNPELHNPEDLLLASVSSCHLLWYLHFCSVNKILVLEYEDFAEGTMIETENGSGKFSEITLKPRILVAEKEMIQKAVELHQKANEYCFIANSLNFEVKQQPEITYKEN